MSTSSTVSPASLTVHLIGHGHIDPTWLWRWTEGYEEVRATFRSALDRMNETDDFKFTASSACFYAWVEENDSAMFDEIRARVAEGRWDIVGGWWIEPDCNVPSGESFVRQGLYGQRYFQRAFGTRATVAFNPDSFGHAGTFPQIFSKMGLHYYAHQRPEPVREMNFPGGTTFWWRAKDGSEVLSAAIIESYNASAEELRELLGRIHRYPHFVDGQTQVLGFYGVGNHGGGPTRENIAAIHEMQHDAAGPTLVFARLDEYFTAFLETQTPSTIPAVTTDLQHHARGCYTVHAEVKALNRATEHALMAAERWATVDWLINGTPYPADAIEQAWKDLLYNQFHDILAGTSIEPSYEDTRDQIGGARFAGKRITNASLQRIARRIDTSAEGNTIVVFNPLPWPVTQAVEISPIIVKELHVASGEALDDVHLVDDSGHTIPHQAVWSDRLDRRSYTITASVPGLGYRCYHARPGTKQVSSRNELSGDRTSLENTWWRIEIDPLDGTLLRLYDKKHKTEVLNRGNILSVLVDNSDTWSHDVKEWNVEEGRFRAESIELLEIGDIRATIRIRSRYNASHADQFLTLYREVDTIDYRIRVNWQEAYRMLKLVYDTAIETAEAIADTAYGCQERSMRGHEEPCQKWTELGGTIGGRPYGFSLLNDSKYGFDVRGNVMRLSLLRSPAYAHHQPARYTPDAVVPIMDQGWHDIRLRLVPHAGTWSEAGVPREAWELHEPLVAHVESAHPGDLPATASFMSCGDDSMLVGVLKKCEDSEDLVVRGYEGAGRAGKMKLEWPYWRKHETCGFAAHEIKTLRVDRTTFSASEVNLLEEPEARQ